jgi:tetratricopeptide (TPR) repeat protein
MFGLCNVLINLRKISHIVFLGFLIVLLVISSCNNHSDNESKNILADTLVYLNHSDSAKYVGINTCKQCHQNIYNSFIKTGMGQSFGEATELKSKAIFSNSKLYDSFNHFNYTANFLNKTLYITEYRLKKFDTTFCRREKVDFIVGSGQHTNSHIQSTNGYMTQMPMTFYTQKQKWDLPPGFEDGINTRFNRKIGLECMSCHNAYPNFVVGSENKYTTIPTGIDCERCHGPGSIHVSQKQSGQIVDTSKYIDYSIVNPAKLGIEEQFDVCQRCHLQGNAILKQGKSFLDFKPGKKLNEYISIFLPKYSNSDKDFIMASHADRLKQSACFIKSLPKEKSKQLKPYKEALTCITCHNPHISVKETNKNVFNDACKNCHYKNETDEKEIIEKHAVSKLKKIENCVSCHMPLSGSIDIPHVTVHDHYIRKPITKKEENKIKAFLGLFSINEKNPSTLVKAKAYLNQFEKFDAKPFYLDSAEKLISNCNTETCLALKIQLFFIKQNFKTVISLIESQTCSPQVHALFMEKSLDNNDAWTCYRIGESYANFGMNDQALIWLKKAIDLAPFNLEFRNKVASAYMALKNNKEAEKQWEFILTENPKFVLAYTNLAYLKLQEGQNQEAFRLLSNGQKLDPDNESLLLNLATYYLIQKNKKEAISILQNILKINPKNTKAKNGLLQIN